jgi:FKBP-type peptidyl-prolyl cis-trans isomerase
MTPYSLSLRLRPAHALVVASALLLAAPAYGQLTPSPANPAPLTGTDTVRLKSGVRYWTTQVGAGERPSTGQKVWIHYTGRLPNGKIFDTSQITGKPLKFTIGVGQVIPGMDEMVSLMHVGQKVTVFIPSQLGYGPAGQPDDSEEEGQAAYRIPPNSDLYFDLELVKCTK